MEGGGKDYFEEVIPGNERRYVMASQAETGVKSGRVGSVDTSHVILYSNDGRISSLTKPFF